MKGIPHSPGEAARLRFVMLTYMNLAMLHLIQARDAAQRVGRERDAGFFDTGATIIKVQSDEARRVTAQKKKDTPLYGTPALLTGTGVAAGTERNNVRSWGI